jgi:hypothetical protein
MGGDFDLNNQVKAYLAEEFSDASAVLKEGQVLDSKTCGVVENSGKRWASISFYRTANQSQCEASDLEVIRFLAPHMQRAFKLHSDFAELTARASVLETGLSEYPVGVILFGENGKVLFANKKASTLLFERNGLISIRGRLKAERPSESATLDEAVASATSTAGVSKSTFPVSS